MSSRASSKKYPLPFKKLFLRRSSPIRPAGRKLRATTFFKFSEVLPITRSGKIRAAAALQVVCRWTHLGIRSRLIGNAKPAIWESGEPARTRLIAPIP